MADLSFPSAPSLWARADKVWLLVLAIPFVVLALDPPAAWPTVTGALGAMAHTGPFILFAVAAIGFLKATGAESLLAQSQIFLDFQLSDTDLGRYRCDRLAG